MSLHADHLALKGVGRTIWMCGLDERVLRALQVVDVVALNGLLEKRNADQQDKADDDQQFAAHAGRMPIISQQLCWRSLQAWGASR